MELIKRVLERAGAQVSVVSEGEKGEPFIHFFTKNKCLPHNIHKACVIERLNNDAWQLIALFPSYTEHASSYAGWTRLDMHYKLFAKNELDSNARRHLTESVKRLSVLIEKTISSSPAIQN